LRRLILSWLPVAIWAALIFGSSTSQFGGEETSRVIVPVLHFVFPAASADTLDLMHEFIRKCAHFVDYFVLGALLYRAVRGGNRGWQLRWALLAVFVAFAYASSDEYHQSFEAGRGASLRDALLDTVGASAAQYAIFLYLRPRATRATSEIAQP
jgi:VanZ family protein